MKHFTCPVSNESTFPSNCRRFCDKTKTCNAFRENLGNWPRPEPQTKKIRVTRDFNGIPVMCPEGLTDEEFYSVCSDELKIWEAKKRAISAIDISIDGDELVIFTREKSPIKRLRRITGYLSVLDSFNDAKKAEEADRISHFKAPGGEV